MMNLYLLTSRDNVKQRWMDISTQHQVSELEVVHLTNTNFSSSGCLLVHIDSLNKEQLELISTFSEKVHLIGFSDNPNDAQGIKILLQGFKGYINTFVTASIFDGLLKSIHKGDIWAGSSIVQKMLKHLLKKEIEASGQDQNICLKEYKLTDREEQTVNILMTGASNKEIARKLGITERTVKAHVGSILSKTNTVDRITLIIKLKDSNIRPNLAI